MKINVFLLLFVCFSLSISSGYAQSNDSIRIVNHEKRIVCLEQQNNGLQKQNAILQEEIVKLGKKYKEISDRLVSTDSTIASVDEQYGHRLEQTNSTIQNNETKQQKSVLWGIVIAAVLAVVSLIMYLLLRIRIAKKGNDIELLRARADDLNRQIVERMDKELGELLKIVSQTPTSANNSTTEPDHTLVKTLADRITFMEMTLYRMDPSVKGHKHLTRSIKQMKDNLLANGYELVDMLGKDYKEGMKVTASFVVDENLDEGKQIITGITKPQINYKGKMIQAAQITVSQNI